MLCSDERHGATAHRVGIVAASPNLRRLRDVAQRDALLTRHLRLCAVTVRQCLLSASDFNCMFAAFAVRARTAGLPHNP